MKSSGFLPCFVILHYRRKIVDLDPRSSLSVPVQGSSFAVFNVVFLMLAVFSQARTSVSKKTVQLVGIPDILDEENLQDNLEIHFQKPSSGGGEVDAFVYIPLGKKAVGIFEEDTSSE